jgi:hypothetical protein
MLHFGGLLVPAMPVECDRIDPSAALREEENETF